MNIKFFLIFFSVFLVAIFLAISMRVALNKISKSYHYTEQGRCITVWKHAGGRSYIMPYKYTKWKFPKENYFETETLSYLDLYWTSDTTIYVYNYRINVRGDIEQEYFFTDKYNIIELETRYDLKTEPINWSSIAHLTLDTINTTMPDYSTHVSIKRVELKSNVIDFLSIYIAGGFDH